MVEAAAERQQPFPDWYEAEPELEAGEHFYVRSFWELSTERSIGYSIGPIPGSRTREYALASGLDASMVGLFARVVRTLDGQYLKWCRDEQKRAREKQE